MFSEFFGRPGLDFFLERRVAVVSGGRPLFSSWILRFLGLLQTIDKDTSCFWIHMPLGSLA
jgi:hypothetical protein